MHLNHHFPFFFFPSASSTAISWPAVQCFKNEYDISAQNRLDVLVNRSPKAVLYQ